MYGQCVEAMRLLPTVRRDLQVAEYRRSTRFEPRGLLVSCDHISSQFTTFCCVSPIFQPVCAFNAALVSGTVVPLPLLFHPADRERRLYLQFADA